MRKRQHNPLMRLGGASGRRGRADLAKTTRMRKKSHHHLVLRPLAMGTSSKSHKASSPKNLDSKSPKGLASKSPKGLDTQSPKGQRGHHRLEMLEGLHTTGGLLEVPSKQGSPLDAVHNRPRDPMAVGKEVGSWVGWFVGLQSFWAAKKSQTTKGLKGGPKTKGLKGGPINKRAERRPQKLQFKEVPCGHSLFYGLLG
jgi:hypothetical protein